MTKYVWGYEHLPDPKWSGVLTGSYGRVKLPNMGGRLYHKQHLQEIVYKTHCCREWLSPYRAPKLKMDWEYEDAAEMHRVQLSSAVLPTKHLITKQKVGVDYPRAVIESRHLPFDYMLHQFERQIEAPLMPQLTLADFADPAPLLDKMIRNVARHAVLTAPPLMRKHVQDHLWPLKAYQFPLTGWLQRNEPGGDWERKFIEGLKL